MRVTLPPQYMDSCVVYCRCKSKAVQLPVSLTLISISAVLRSLKADITKNGITIFQQIGKILKSSRKQGWHFQTCQEIEG